MVNESISMLMQALKTKSVREFTKWLINNGIGVVFTMGIFFVMVFYFPEMWKESDERQRQRVESVIAAFQEDQKRDERRSERDAELVRTLLNAGMVMVLPSQTGLEIVDNPITKFNSIESQDELRGYRWEFECELDSIPVSPETIDARTIE